MSVDEEQARAWTVAETRAKLSEVMRLAESEGPQRVGVRKQYVIMPEHVWEECQEPPQMPLGQWLLENFRGLCEDFPLPSRRSTRPIPFDEYVDDSDDQSR